MPLVSSRFHPPVWLRNGHVQTIVGALVRSRGAITFRRERLELADGDFLDLDWMQSSRDRLAIVSHGLEGRSTNGYIRGIAAALAEDRWDVLAWNFRGCGGEPNRLPRFYHSGETQDLAEVIRHGARNYSTIALVGFSLGGNVTLKYLGETPSHPAVAAAVAISVPVDLAACAAILDSRRGNRVYLRRFLKTLIAKAEAKAVRFPDQFDAGGPRGICSIAEFDERFTAPLHGFSSAADYWARSSALQYLHRVAVPTLLLNAQDDPFLAPSCFPKADATANRMLFLETPRFGGHVGFLHVRKGLRRWSDARAVQFLQSFVERAEA